MYDGLHPSSLSFVKTAPAFLSRKRRIHSAPDLALPVFDMTVRVISNHLSSTFISCIRQSWTRCHNIDRPRSDRPPELSDIANEHGTLIKSGVNPGLWEMAKTMPVWRRWWMGLLTDTPELAKVAIRSSSAGNATKHSYGSFAAHARGG